MRKLVFILISFVVVASQSPADLFCQQQVVNQPGFNLGFPRPVEHDITIDCPPPTKSNLGLPWHDTHFLTKKPENKGRIRVITLPSFNLGSLWPVNHDISIDEPPKSNLGVPHPVEHIFTRKLNDNGGMKKRDKQQP